MLAMSDTAESLWWIVAGLAMVIIGCAVMRTDIWERFGRLTVRIGRSRILDEEDGAHLFRFVGWFVPVFGAAWVVFGLGWLVRSL